MKTRILMASLLALGIGGAMANVTINIPEECALETINYYYAPIKQFASAKNRAERVVVIDSVAVNNSKAVINITSEQPFLMGLDVASHDISLYGSPEDNIILTVVSCEPFNYELSGSSLAKAMNELNQISQPVINKFYDATPAQQQNEEYMQGIVDEYNLLQVEFIKADPKNPAAPVALLNLNGEDFIEVYEQNQENFNNSILYPLLQKQYDAEKENLEKQKKQEALQSGKVEAPAFTLKNLDGKDTSLSDFKGKWVILDFWGSWCPWCIKGFPELKEAYATYHDKLEIIGIDCRESEAEWRAGVEKYKLPWVNVYNPENSPVLEEYGVQGFPTKVIIDPEGKIRNITVGHDPAFFDVLTSLIAQ